MEALEKMKALWDAAPTVPALAGAKVKLPGFAIPLENKGGKVSEFSWCLTSAPASTARRRRPTRSSTS
jgi:hypothetical protein